MWLREPGSRLDAFTASPRDGDPTISRGAAMRQPNAPYGVERGRLLGGAATGDDPAHAGLSRISEGLRWLRQGSDLHEARHLADIGVTLHYREPALDPLSGERSLCGSDFLLCGVGGSTKRRIPAVLREDDPPAFAAATA